MRVLLLAFYLSLNLFAGVSDFENYLHDETEDQTPPSASFAVLKGDEIVYERSFGFNDAKQSQRTSL